MLPVRGTELAEDKTVFRLIREDGRFVPPGARVPNGAAFEPSDYDKQEAKATDTPVRVSCWDTDLTTVGQAKSLRPDRGPTLPFGLHVSDLVEIRKTTESRLRVVSDPLDPPRGAGSEGHCGIEGLDRPTGGDKKLHKAKLDEVALRAFPLPESRSIPTAEPPNVADEVTNATADETHLGHPKPIALRRWLAGVVVLTFALTWIVMNLPGRESQRLRAVKLEAEKQVGVVRAKAVETIAQALEESEKAEIPPLLSPSPSPRAFVFIGLCDRLWSHTFFDGVPPCDTIVPPGGVIISASRGIKARSALPSRGRFATEVGRLGKGERARLVRLHAVTVLDAPGPHLYWGEVEWPPQERER
jgi:hypothetical protein